MKARIRFVKLGKIRFTSHRDVARMWERSLRRGRIPVAYSEGFSPRPKLAFGLALPTGFESYAEYLDVNIADEQFDVESLAGRLEGTLPVGVEVTAVGLIDRKVDSLQQAIDTCTWQADISGVSLAQVRASIDELVAADSIPVTRQRKGKEVKDDLRPGIVSLDVTEVDAHNVRLLADLGTKPRGLRPTELLAECNPPLEAARVVRLHQWIQQGDTRVEPLIADAVAPTEMLV
jgi:radical SAM-linked protein